MKTLRLFIALPISEEIREKLKGLQEIGRGKGLSARWVSPEGIHLTLVFLGWTDPGLQAKIEEEVDNAARLSPPFTLHVSGLGVFPRLRAPRVIWAGVEEAPGLMALQRRLSLSMAELGFEPEARPYQPHLTLGRVESRPNRYVGAPAAEQEAGPPMPPRPAARTGKAGSSPYRKTLDSFSRWITAGKDLEIGKCKTEEVVLMKSELRPGGSVYVRLFASQLRG